MHLKKGIFYVNGTIFSFSINRKYQPKILHVKLPKRMQCAEYRLIIISSPSSLNSLNLIYEKSLPENISISHQSGQTLIAHT